MYTLDAVVRRQPLVKHREVRINHMRRVCISADQFAHESDRLLDHVVANRWQVWHLGSRTLASRDVVQEPGEQVTIDWHGLHLFEAQPLSREVFDKTMRSRIGQHSQDLLLNHRWVV